MKPIKEMTRLELNTYKTVTYIKLFWYTCAGKVIEFRIGTVDAINGTIKSINHFINKF